MPPAGGASLVRHAASRDSVQPGQRVGRDIVKSPPRGEEHIGHKVIGIGGRQAATSKRVQRLVAGVEQPAESKLSVAHRLRLRSPQAYDIWSRVLLRRGAVTATDGTDDITHGVGPWVCVPV